MADRCDVCKTSFASLTLFRCYEKDPNMSKILHCNLNILLTAEIINMCDECLLVLDKCHIMYCDLKDRLSKTFPKTPNSCMVCFMDGPNVQDYHISQVAPRGLALQHVSQVCLMTFEPMFVRMCDECWGLMEKIQYFYDKIRFQEKFQPGTPGSEFETSSDQASPGPSDVTRPGPSRRSY